MEDNNAEIMAEFILESKQNLSEVEADLLTLEKNGADSETINRIFRAIHSMKGSSGYLGLENILSVSHLGETLLDEIRNNLRPLTPEVVDILLSMLDALSEMLELEDLGASYDVSEVIAKLKNILQTGEPSTPTKNSRAELQHNDISDSLKSLNLSEAETELLLDSAAGRMNIYKLTLKSGLSAEATIRTALEEIGKIIAVRDEGILLGTVLEEEMLDMALDELIQSHYLLSALEIKFLDPSSEIAPGRSNLPTSAKPTAPKTTLKRSKNNEKPSQKNSNKNNGSNGTGKDEAQMIKINARLLDELLRFTGNMVMSRNQLLTKYDFSDDPAFSTLSQAITEVHKNVVQTRMLSVESVFERFRRMVRDLSRQLNKKIDFKIFHGNLELDRTILEAFIDPITHMVRNSVDHGIETSEERSQTNKNPIASVTLRAFQESGEIIISIEDDGKGIDPTKIKTIAVERGVITLQQAESLSEQEAIMLVFEPGFSTAQKLSKISGRGVGMDVVKTNIEKIGGVIDCVSELGIGTKMQARLPLTKAMVTSSLISALVVSVDKQRFCIPQSAVNELITISERDSRDKIKILQGQKVFQHRELVLPILNLKDILEIGNTPDSEEPEIKPASKPTLKIDTHTLIVLQHRNNLFGVMVDAIIGIEEAVVRDMPKLVEHVGIFSGHTVLGDGRVVMIIDTNGIVERMQMSFITKTHKDDDNLPALSVGKRADRQSMIIFNYADSEYFAVPLELVSLIEKIHRNDIKTVGNRQYYPMKDHTIPLLYLDKYLPVTPISKNLDNYNLILPSRVKYPVGVITNSNITVCDVSGKFDETITDNNGILGTFMHNDNLVMLLDLYSLFECDDPNRFERDNEYHEAAHILIVEDSLFYRRLNATYLQAEGRELTLVGDGVEALAALRDSSKSFDLVVSDIEMPNMNGFELIKEIRADPNLKDIPVIALTALQDDQSREKGLSLGFDEYVVKVDKDGLNDSVNRYARQAHASRVHTLPPA